MGKKNPFVFTIGFDKSDPDHVYVTELLNTTEKKAKLIVAAILAYTGRTDETGNGSISMEPDMLRPMMQQIIREEVRKVLEGQDVSKINREMPTEVDLMEEEPLRMDQTMRQNAIERLVRSWKVNVGIPIFRISVMICLEGQNSLMENVKALFFCNA